MNDSPQPTIPRWLHGWALLTLCAALPLIVLGAEVTTRQVGMADPQSVREPWYLLLVPKDQLEQQGSGLLIEHSHRTAGWLVGMCAIVLAAGMWFGARGTGFRAAGCVTLTLVIVQGLLGIFRVQLHARIGPEMAMVHGLFAQVVFATLVAVAVVTSRAQWRVPPPGDRHGLRRIALFVAVASFAQIVFGALVRHQHGALAQRLHALTAFVVVAAVVWLFWESRSAPEDRPIRRAAGLLVALVAVQVVLGVEAWLRRFGAGVPVELVRLNMVDDAFRTAHYFVGALLFSTTVAVNLLLYRPAIAPAVILERPLADGRFAAGIGGTL